MPIIEPRKGPNSGESSRPDARPSPDNIGQSSFISKPHDGGRLSGGLIFILGVLGIIILFGGYYYWHQVDNSSNGSTSKSSLFGSTSTSSEIGSKSGLAIHRFAKLASIASLSRKEFEVNFVSLDEARRAGNPQIIAALEIIIQKKRQEFTESKEKMIESLMELNLLRQSQPSTVDGLVQAAISEAKSREESETARILESLTSMLENVPVSAPAKQYFSDAIENRL